MGWVKPYLKHIKRLQMSEEQLDSADLISSFETSATEIEVICTKDLPKSSYNAVVLMTYHFTTRPIMQYRQEYNQGPVHVGKGMMTFRAYSWTDKQIEQYKQMRDDEDRELLGLVDDQLKAAMDMLGSDLDSYLKEAEATLGKKHDEFAKPPVSKKKRGKKIVSQDSVFEPFISVFKGFWEIGGLLVPKGFGKSPKDSETVKGKPGPAMGAAKMGMWLTYKNYKKAHKMLSW